MPTFTYDNNAASNSGVILLEVPDVAWFKDSVMSAIAEMTVPENWFGDDIDYEKYAVLQANLMVTTYKVLNFNPFPVGMVVQMAVDTAPPGYLACDGSEYSQTEYPELYSAIGEVFIDPDAHTFFTPSISAGLSINQAGTSSSGRFFNMGGRSLDETRQIEVDNMPYHNHPDNGHAHGIQLTTDGLAVAPGELPVVVPIPIIPGTTDTGYADIGYVGGDVPFSIVPPYYTLNFYIYAGR